VRHSRHLAGRIRFTNVKVPRENLLHQEGKGLNVALTCLNHGRCTLSAGVLGGARRASEQAMKWAATRYQFQRPIADFELVQAAIARMAALTYAMDAVLFQTCGMLDRHDEDIMVETAACKVFCSEMGWRVVNDAMQVMGGEGYMTENEVERIFRDCRINLIVEGTNEVMHSFIFGYGGKQLAEQMLGVQQAVGWNHEESTKQNLSRIFQQLTRSDVRRVAAPLGAELFLGIQPHKPAMHDLDESLAPAAERFAQLVREHSHQFKLAAKHYGEQIVARQAVQARLADSAMWLYAWACTISKLDRALYQTGLEADLERDKAAAFYFMDLAAAEIRRNLHDVLKNDDDSMRRAAETAIKYIDTLPNADFYIPESSPTAKGTGRAPARELEPPGDSHGTH
jgi:acyl-CoA dehydrogenase family protein 9